MVRLGTTASARQSRCYTATMPDDMTRHAATHDVPPRHAATNDSTYCLTPDAVVERLAHAGVPRDLRTVQRWCKRGALDCLRDDAVGYFITEQSSAASS